MSIVNSIGERVFLDPEPHRARPVSSPAIRRRNRRWLARKRRDDLTVRELARLVGHPPATVAAGLLWAEEREDVLEAGIVAKLRPPVLDARSGLDVDDVLYLAETYPAGTDLGDHPGFWAFLDPLLDRIFAGLENEPAATNAEAA